jgi:tRNA nucleotidyltransferase (CCA-adding enzyme)
MLAAARGKIRSMEVPSPEAMIAQIRSLAAAHPLFSRGPDAVPVWLVGGAVRDLLIGHEPAELDLVVQGDPHAAALQLGGTTRAHDRFGTTTVTVGQFTYDIVRERRESYAHPGALPDVEPGTLAEDLARRDFTVNAIATALSGPHPGQLVAAPLALADLAARRLRVLYDRSFIDDPTRLLRMARYHGRLGFAVERGTLTLARAALEAGALATVSGTRIGAELRLLAREGDPIAAFTSLHELGVDRAIDPRFGLADPSLAAQALALLPEDAHPDLLVLAVASRRLPADELGRLLDELAFAAADRETVVAAATRSGELAAELEQARSPSEIAVAAATAPPELVALAGALGPVAAAREWLTGLRHVKLEIDGAALLAAGIEQGPAIGRGLSAALAAKLDGRVAGRDAELAYALAAARAGDSLD